MSDIQETIRQASQALETAPDDKKITLATQLARLVDGFLTKISDFADIPQHYFEHVEPQMNAQIDAVGKKTEDAADAILTACENMGKAIKDAPDDVKAAVQKEINAIFEASNFQDLVSQHANEIRLLVTDISADMGDIQNFAGDGDGDDNNTSERTRNKNKRADNHLLNGPAVSVK